MGAKQVTDSSFQSEVVSHSGFALVDFWAEWCGPCRMMAPVIDALSTKYADKVKIMKMDVDVNPNTAQELNIVSIPCLILFKGGQEVTRFTGFKPQAAFEADLLKFVG